MYEKYYENLVTIRLGTGAGWPAKKGAQNRRLTAGPAGGGAGAGYFFNFPAGAGAGYPRLAGWHKFHIFNFTQTNIFKTTLFKNLKFRKSAKYDF